MDHWEQNLSARTKGIRRLVVRDEKGTDEKGSAIRSDGVD
jgi:hypothetical protein